MASVTYRNVYKNWGDVKVIKDLSIDIKDQEFVVLVGPSGCGKEARRCAWWRAWRRSATANSHRRSRRQRRAAEGS